MDFPTLPPLEPTVPGQPITVGSFNALGSAARRQRITAGQGVRVREAGPDGVIVDIDPAAVSALVAPPLVSRAALVKADMTGEVSAGLRASIFANGPTQPSTGSCTVYFAECLMGVVSAGTWLVGFPGLVFATGGND